MGRDIWRLATFSGFLDPGTGRATRDGRQGRRRTQARFEGELAPGQLYLDEGLSPHDTVGQLGAADAEVAGRWLSWGGPASRCRCRPRRSRVRHLLISSLVAARRSQERNQPADTNPERKPENGKVDGGCRCEVLLSGDIPNSGAAAKRRSGFPLTSRLDAGAKVGSRKEER
jgi:hypothetical protein